MITFVAPNGTSTRCRHFDPLRAISDLFLFVLGFLFPSFFFVAGTPRREAFGALKPPLPSQEEFVRLGNLHLLLLCMGASNERAGKQKETVKKHARDRCK